MNLDSGPTEDAGAGTCLACGLPLAAGGVCVSCALLGRLATESDGEPRSRVWMGHALLEESPIRGGMGVVWKARHLVSGRIVALKMVRLDRLASPEALSRFRAEMALAARLSHPHVLPVLEAGEHRGQKTKGQVTYFAQRGSQSTPYIRGRNTDAMGAFSQLRCRACLRAGSNQGAVAGSRRLRGIRSNTPWSERRDGPHLDLIFISNKQLRASLPTASSGCGRNRLIRAWSSARPATLST